MWPFRKTRSEIERQNQLLQENNSLLREQLVAAGHQPVTPRTPTSTAPARQRTAADIVRVTRADRLQMQRAAQEAATTPWRGQESVPKAAPDGGTRPVGGARPAENRVNPSAPQPHDPM